MPRWYYSTNGKAEGPVETPFLIENLQAGRFTLVDLVFKEGESAWKTFGEIPEFRDAYQAPPAPVLHPLLTTPSRGQAPEAEVSRNALPKPESGWPSDWRLTSSWIVLRKRTDSNGYDQDGPFSAEQIIEMIGSGKVEYSQYCWRPGYTRWFRIGNLPEFDRRKRDRENDPVNQIVPVPEINEELPALTREELLANVERLRRQAAPSQEDLGKNLVEDDLSFDETPLKKNDSAGKVKAKPSAAPPVATKPAVKAAAPSVPASAPAKPAQVTQTSPAAATETVAVSAPASPVSSKPVAKSQTPAAAASPAPMTTPQTPVVKPPSQPAAAAVATAAPAQAAPVTLATPKDNRKSAPRALRIGFAALFSALIIFGMIRVITARHPGRSTLASAASAAKPSPRTKRQPTSAALPPAAAPAKPVAPAVAPPPPTAPAAKSPTVLEIVPLKLETSGPSLAFQTNAAPGELIKVTLKAKSGEILKYASFAKSVDVTRAGGEVPTLDLTKFSLPSGSYTVDAVAGSAVTTKQIFIGQRDAAFVSALERHLKSISYRQQLERSVLYYGAVKLTAGAKNLIEQSHDLKSQPAKWQSVYQAWRAAARDASAPVAALTKAPAWETAYPDQLKAFTALSDQLMAETAQVNEAMNQKRDIATAQPLEAVVSALDQLKGESAHLSGRPPAASDQ